MLDKLKLFFNWSEAWAPLIPIFVLAGKRSQPRFLKPVIIYILLVFPINLLGDLISDFKDYLYKHGAANVENWTLESAIGVSADGTTIVGFGTNPDGNT